MNKFEELERIQKLRQSNVLTEQEFEIEKQKILNDTSTEATNTTPNGKGKQKIKPWQIVVMIILIILARFYNSRSCERIYQQ